MNNQPTERTLTSDWDDHDEDAAKATLCAGSKLGPFIVGQFLGQGGMGTVYAATHRETGADVALKTLHRVDTRAEARLKSEFRHLARMRHPRLVQLFELHTIDSNCFLTMERIDGVSLSEKLAEVRLRNADYYDSVRVLFRQVAEGLLALHAEGLLHLDLKPDNVMVDREGAVRILDFGLTLPLSPREMRPRRGIGGTPRYMAPERLRHGEESTSSDWYSFGVMLAERLGTERVHPPEPLHFPPGTPADLADLCGLLLSEEPSQRPSGQEIALRLGVEISGTYRTRGADSPSGLNVVGRDAELAKLEEALTFAIRGGASWLRLSGESGIGKTVLMQHFRNRLRHVPGVTVLEGACHERESMPFQGLDGIMEDLAFYLAKHQLTRGNAEQVLCEHASSLSDAFLELCQGAPTITQNKSPIERRRAAFSAVKSLLMSLTRTETVVLLIDDVHWGDTDGARLLAEILATPTPRHLLLVTTSHPDGYGRASFLEELDAVLAIRNAVLRQESVLLERLAPHDTLACVHPSGENTNRQYDAIVRASGGLPFLAAALGSHPWGEQETPSLRALIDLRLRGTPPGAVAVMQAISLSPSPLPQAVALEQVTDTRLRGAVLAALRNSDLVRTSGATPDAPLEPYHALVAKAVQDQLDPSSRREIRLRLATSLEEKRLASSEQLAHLFYLGGSKEKAAHWAPIAAMDAERSLAFESAAHWFGRTAAWVPENAALYLPEQARCLEYAGRSAEAAQCYEKCSQVIPDKRGEYVRAAGASWLNAGHVDRGLSALVPDLEDLGIPIPKSEGAALTRSFYLLWKLWRRGTEFRALPEASCDPTLLSRVDAVWHAAKVLGAPLPLRGLALQLQCLLLSLQTGETVRIARSLAVLGPTFVGTPWERMGADWSKKAHHLGSQCENDYLHGIILTFDAVRMTARWESPERILECASEAHEILKKERGPIGWEQSMALTAGLRVREQLGRLDELRQLGTQWLAESTDRGDLFAQAMAYQACAMGYLAGDEVEQAREFTRRSVARWSQGSFTVQHYYALRYDVQCDLLAGEYQAAQEKIRRLWPVLKRAQLLRHPISRPEVLLLRGLVELAAGVESGAKSFRSVEKTAEMLRLDQNPVSRAHGLLLAASCSWQKKSSDEAIRCLQMARSEYARAGQVLQGACVELMLAHATFDPEGREAATARLVASGVKSPHRYIRIHVPVVFETTPLPFA